MPAIAYRPVAAVVSEFLEVLDAEYVAEAEYIDPSSSERSVIVVSVRRDPIIPRDKAHVVSVVSRHHPHYSYSHYSLSAAEAVAKYREYIPAKEA